MSKRDYYEVLGVAKGVDEKGLKSAFRKKAMEFHPDRNPDNPDAEQKFKEVNEAYEVLKDPQKRAAYDQMGHAAFQGGMGGGGGAGFDGFSGMNMNDIFDDLFSEVFGGGQRGGGRQRGGGGAGRQRGSDLQYNMDITLEEAFTGKQAEIEIPVAATCESCSGSGAAKGSQPVTCQTCQGAGRVRQAQGFFTVERTCPGCMGQGQTIKDPCKTCHGRGQTQKQKSLSVNIPAGIEDGTRMRLAGEGEAGLRGGPTGDLYIFVSVKPHLFFHRDGNDILCRMPVSMTNAALGGAIEVPTVDGKKVRLAIKAGSQSGNRFRMRGKGMPVLRTPDFGDMYVEILVETPRNLTKKQKELLEEFRKTQGEDHLADVDEPGFFKKVRDFFDHLSDTK